MQEHLVFSILIKLVGLGFAVGCYLGLRRLIRQPWPKADPDAWKDKDDDW